MISFDYKAEEDTRRGMPVVEAVDEGRAHGRSCYGSSRLVRPIKPYARQD